MPISRIAGRTGTFKRFSYEFSVRCDDVSVGDYLSRVLRRFAVEDTPAGGTAYEVVDHGRSDDHSRYELFVDGEGLFGSNTLANVVEMFFSRLNQDTLESTSNLVLVHSGAVVTPEGTGVLLPAPSGSGKTTLVAGLVGAGFGYLSDEAAVLDPVTSILHPYSLHLSLKAASREQFPEVKPELADLALSGLTWRVDPDVIRPGSVASACEVGFVVAHRYLAGAETRLEPLTPAEACIELVKNLMLARRDTLRSLDLLARICRASRSYRLTHGDLDEAVKTIENLTA